jgi:hypothetical protein
MPATIMRRPQERSAMSGDAMSLQSRERAPAGDRYRHVAVELTNRSDPLRHRGDQEQGQDALRRRFDEKTRGVSRIVRCRGGDPIATLAETTARLAGPATGQSQPAESREDLSLCLSRPDAPLDQPFRIARQPIRRLDEAERDLDGAMGAEERLTPLFGPAHTSSRGLFS